MTSTTLVRPLLLGLVALLAGCAAARPISGPGIDAKSRRLQGQEGQSITVVLTHALLRRQGRADFDRYTRKVVADLPNNLGFLAYSIRTRLLGNEVWTMTLWTDGSAADSFVRSPTHRQAMRDGMTAVTGAQFLRFDWPANAAAPTWKEALARLESVPVVRY